MVKGFGRCLLQAVEAMLARSHAAARVLSADIERGDRLTRPVC